MTARLNWSDIHLSDYPGPAPQLRPIRRRAWRGYAIDVARLAIQLAEFLLVLGLFAAALFLGGLAIGAVR